MELKKSMNRFLSIFFIVAMGVAFFTGIHASAPDMRATGDYYFDESSLMDLRVISTLGLTEEDLEVLNGLEGVELAEGCYMEDVYCGEEDAREVLHIESIPESVNALTVAEGSFPTKPGECFLDSKYAVAEGYKPGDVLEITVSSEEDSALKHRKFTVSGYGYSPAYISFERGTTTLGTGEISGFVYVVPEEFDSEVYMVAYLLAEGAKEQMAYTDAYDDLIEAVYDRIDGIADARCEIRYNDIMDEANEKLEDAKQQVADGKQELSDAKQELSDAESEAEQELSEAESELIEGESELADGRQEVADAKQEIADGEQELADGEQEVADNETALQDARTQISSAEAQLNAAEKEYQQGLSEYRKTSGSAKKKLDEAQEQIDAGKTQLEQGWAEYNTNLAAIETGQAQLNGARTQLESSQAEYDAGRAQLDAAWAQYTSGAEQLAAGQAAYDGAVSQAAQLKNAYDAAALAASEAQSAYDAAVSAGDENIQQKLDALTAANTECESARAAYEAANSQLAAQKAELDESAAALAATKQTLDGQETALAAAKTELDTGWTSLNTQQAELMAGKSALEEARKTLEASEKELKQSQDQVDAGRKELKDAKATLASARKELDLGWAELNASKAQLSDGEQQLSDAKTQLSDARTELEDAKGEIADAESEITENEQKIKDGWKDYEDGKLEAEEKIADAKQKIADAEQELLDAEQEIADAEAELADVRRPKWYVDDRSALPENAGFGENADRMSSLAQVFPVIFFLVAALISLTTMTRMVEEERTQIGTMKALGYSKMDIAGKYLKYALYATIGGSIFGTLFGEKVFPWVIITAYGIMYTYLPKIVIPYNLDYALMATGAALFCTFGATLSACYRALQEVPAQLMRPPAPKEGKRVLLEHLPFIWRRINFTWKSTIRNLLRYKKRFLMTIIGIGGCMGLLLVGYGLRDSIMDVGRLQFHELQTYSAMVVLDTDASVEEQNAVYEQVAQESGVSEYGKFYMQCEEVTTGEKTGKEWAPYIYVPENMDNISEFFHFRKRGTDETYTLTDEGAIITEKLAKELGIEVGDTIILEREDGEEAAIPIACICENYLSHYIYMTPALYEQIYGEAPEYNSIFFKSQEEQDVLEEIGGRLLENDTVLNITYTKAIEEQLNGMLEALDFVIVVLIVSAGMLAFVVLYNLNNININERRRELATLRVLGFFNGEVAAYVYRENVLLTVIGAALGVVIGKFLHMFIITTVEVDSCMFGRNINLESFVYATLFTILFSVIVNFVMYFKLKKIDMVESLKSIE